jgi:hypothetical protein
VTVGALSEGFFLERSFTGYFTSDERTHGREACWDHRYDPPVEINNFEPLPNEAPMSRHAPAIGLR